MDAFVIYQQDTSKVKILIHSIPEKKELDGIPNRQKPISILDVQANRQVAERQQEKSYSPEQIRNWRTHQENKMLIESSKYLSKRTEMGIGYSESTNTGVILPVREINRVNTDWLTAILFLAIILFGTVRYAYGKYIKHVFLSLFNYATSMRLFQEKNYPVFHGAFRLEAIFYLTFSVFIFQALNMLKWKNIHLNPTYFLLILGMVLLYFFGKKLIYSMLGSLFNASSETREFLFNIDNFNRSLGLLLLPVAMLVSFAPAEHPVFIVYAGIIIASIFYLTLLLRGIFILLKKQFPIFYLFLYLCTLEFLPLLLIYKVVVE